MRVGARFVRVKLWGLNAVSASARHSTRETKGAHLAGVEQVQRVDRPFDRLHELDSALTKLFVQVLALADTYAMFARACM